MPAPTFDDLAIYRAALALLEKARPAGKPVRLLGVGVADLHSEAEPRQAELFASDAPERVLRAVDSIRARFGKGAIRHGGR